MMRCGRTLRCLVVLLFAAFMLDLAGATEVAVDSGIDLETEVADMPQISVDLDEVTELDEPLALDDIPDPADIVDLDGLAGLEGLDSLAGLDERTRFHAHKGVEAFNRDWTSVTEAAALWRIEQQALETNRVATAISSADDRTGP